MHTVIGIVDTRTLLLDDGTQLRLSALLGPTAYDSPAAPDHWPLEVAAREALAARVLGHNVAVFAERAARDRYGRLVGQVVAEIRDGAAAMPTPEGWLQAQMIRGGHARVALTPEVDVACARQLLNEEARAQAAQRGLWRHALYQPKRAEDTRQLRRYRSTFQIVEGVVARVALRRSAVYLNFGRDWKRDFTAKLGHAMLKRAGFNSADLKRLRKQAVRIRGWIEKRNGPLITIWRPEQIELISIDHTGQTVRDDPPRLLTDTASRHRATHN